jgi:hypothetical protein
MRLTQDPTARARLRLLQPWLTAEQFIAVERGLEEVEVAPRPSLWFRARAAWRAARIAWGAPGGLLPPGEAETAN